VGENAGSESVAGRGNDVYELKIPDAAELLEPAVKVLTMYHCCHTSEGFSLLL
jgi:hypothetical protein